MRNQASGTAIESFGAFFQSVYGAHRDSTAPSFEASLASNTRRENVQHQHQELMREGQLVFLDTS
jgi:hypothetical protein